MRSAKTMVVAGVMSGTSADGIDVALVRLSPPRGSAGAPSLKLLGHASFAYPRAIRAAILQAMNSGEQTTVAEIARLNWRLGELYAHAIQSAAAQFQVKLALVGLHGQTIYHQARPTHYLGKPVRATWQIGEAAIVAEQLHVPVVSDFRPADLAADGQGAPLVPMLDFHLFRSQTKHRLLLNLGGIANLTAIPAQAKLIDVIAFDTGPANMVIDALMQSAFGKTMDRGGKIAARGRALPAVVAELMRHPFITALPPKTCGREQFGVSFARQLRDLCAASGATDEDTIATATELTAASILNAYEQFCRPHLKQHAARAYATEVVVAGGGTQNLALMQRLRDGFTSLGVEVFLSDELGLPAQAKEAAAFALLAWLSWHKQPGNVPAATGAKRGVILGKVSFS